MKKILSVILITVMLFMLVVMPVHADTSGNFQITVKDGEFYVLIGWAEEISAHQFEVIVRDVETRELLVDEFVTTHNYEWVPGYDVRYNERFEIHVIAYDSDGDIIARGKPLTVAVPVIVWDYWGYYGDVDRDYDITVLDATRIQHYIVNRYDPYMSTANADVDGDGEIVILDATYIQFYCAQIGVEQSRAGEEFWLYGGYYDVEIIEPEEEPTIPPTVVEPTDPVPTEEPTDPK